MSLGDLNQPFKYTGVLSNLLLCSSHILFFLSVLLQSISLIPQRIGFSWKNSSMDIFSLVFKEYRDFLPNFRFSLMTREIVEAFDTADTTKEVSESENGEFWFQRLRLNGLMKRMKELDGNMKKFVWVGLVLQQ